MLGPGLGDGLLDPGGPGDAGGIVKFLGGPDDLSSGSISLYEMNIDKPMSGSVNGIYDYGFAYAWLPKSSNLQTFKTITTASIDEKTSTIFAEMEYGEKVKKLYPLSASISINYFSESNGFAVADPNATASTPDLTDPNLWNWGAKKLADPSTTREIEALQNTLNFYTKWSPHYAYSSSVPPGCDKAKQAMSFIEVPSIYYGSNIEKGSVNLKFYISSFLCYSMYSE